MAYPIGTPKDGARMEKDLDEVYRMPGGKGKILGRGGASRMRQAQHRIEVRPCLENDIVEIDTFNELKKNRSGLQHLRPLSSGRP